MRFNQGDVVVIKSPTSVFRGYVGIFAEYRKGKCSDICLVHLLNGKGVQLCDRSLEKTTDKPLRWDAVMGRGGQYV